VDFQFQQFAGEPGPRLFGHFRNVGFDLRSPARLPFGLEAVTGEVDCFTK
jgi:hypothetical protein